LPETTEQQDIIVGIIIECVVVVVLLLPRLVVPKPPEHQPEAAAASGGSRREQRHRSPGGDRNDDSDDDPPPIAAASSPPPPPPSSSSSSPRDLLRAPLDIPSPARASRNVERTAIAAGVVHEIAAGVERSRDIRRACLAGIGIAWREDREGVRTVVCHREGGRDVPSLPRWILDVAVVVVVVGIVVVDVVQVERQEAPARKVQKGRRAATHPPIVLPGEGSSAARRPGHGRGL